MDLIENPILFINDELSIIRKFPNHAENCILYYLFSAYTENHRYKEALELIKQDRFYFHNFFKYHDIFSREKSENLEGFYKNIEDNIRMDISLIVADSFSDDESYIEEWKKRLDSCLESKDKDGNYPFYKMMSDFILKLIMVLFANGEYRLTREFLALYNKYLLVDEDYRGMSGFVESILDKMKHETIFKEIKDLIEQGVREIKTVKSDILSKIPDHSRAIDGYMDQIITSLKITTDKLARVEITMDNFMSFMLDMRKKYEQYTRCLSRDDLENSQWIPANELLVQGMNHLSELLDKKGLDLDIDQVEQELILSFGENNWLKLHPETRKSMITGNIIFSYLKSKDNYDQLDFATACIAWCRAVENEVTKRIYSPLLNKYIRNSRDNDYRFFSFVKETKVDKERNVVFSWPKIEQFTMGSFRYFTGCDYNGNMIKEREYQRFKKFATRYVFKGLDEQVISVLIKDLSKDIANLTANFRNQCAHPNPISIETAKGCYKMICVIEEILIKIAQSYDLHWCENPTIP